MNRENLINCRAHEPEYTMTALYMAFSRR